MGEEKEKMDRLRAKRGGHRTVVTKNINEARTILEHTDLEHIMWSRLKVVGQILDEKLISLAGFDEEITKICSVDHIEEEIEVADEIRSRILQTKGKIAIARARVKNGRTSSSILRLHMVRHKIIIRRNIQPPITQIQLLCHYRITNMPHQKIQVKFVRVIPDHHRVLHFKLISQQVEMVDLHHRVP